MHTSVEAAKHAPDYVWTSWDAEGGFHNKAGAYIATYHWYRPNPKGVIFIVPGYGDCSSTYSHVAACFVSAGYAVYAWDHEGFGKSGGVKGLLRNWESQLTDGLTFIRSTMRLFPEDTPCLLFGHSMGGAVTLDLAIRNPDLFNGIVVSAPLVGIKPGRYPELLIQFAIHFGQYIPTWLQSIPIAGAANAVPTCSDPKIVDLYRHDPLIYHGGVRLGSGLNMIAMTKKLERSLHRLTVPFLVVHGLNDPLTDPEMSRVLYLTAQSRIKRIWLVAGAAHDLSNEPNRWTIIRGELEFFDQLLGYENSSSDGSESDSSPDSL